MKSTIYKVHLINSVYKFSYQIQVEVYLLANIMAENAVILRYILIWYDVLKNKLIINKKLHKQKKSITPIKMELSAMSDNFKFTLWK
jgi:hypothetical protein